MSEFLFLDIDDVLNSEQFHERNPWIREDGVDPDEHPRTWIDPEAVERLNRILEETETNPEVILSSTWRHSFDAVEMTDILRDRGFNHHVCGSIPGRPRRLRHQTSRGYNRPAGMVRERGDHILNFLKFKRNVDRLESVVVLDNLPEEELAPFEDHLIQTVPEDGLQERHVESALEILEQDVKGISLEVDSGR